MFSSFLISALIAIILVCSRIECSNRLSSSYLFELQVTSQEPIKLTPIQTTTATTTSSKLLTVTAFSQKMSHSLKYDSVEVKHLENGVYLTMGIKSGRIVHVSKFNARLNQHQILCQSPSFAPHFEFRQLDSSSENCELALNNDFISLPNGKGIFYNSDKRIILSLDEKNAVQEELNFSFDSLHLKGESLLIAMKKKSANSYKATISVASKWLELNDPIFKLDEQELSDTIQMLSSNKIVYISAESNSLVEFNLDTHESRQAKKENVDEKIIAFDLTPTRDLIYVEFSRRIRVFVSTNSIEDLSQVNFAECSLSGSFENIQTLLKFKAEFSLSSNKHLLIDTIYTTKNGELMKSLESMNLDRRSVKLSLAELNQAPLIAAQFKFRDEKKSFILANTFDQQEFYTQTTHDSIKWNEAKSSKEIILDSVFESNVKTNGFEIFENLNQNTSIVASGSDYLRKSFNLYKTVDNECTKWKEILTGEFFYAFSFKFNTIVAAPKQSDSQQFIYYSVDAGESWQTYQLFTLDSHQTIRGVIYDENINRFILIAALSKENSWRVIQVGIDTNHPNARCTQGPLDSKSVPFNLDAVDENEEPLCILSNICFNRTQLLLTLVGLFCLITLSTISLFCLIAKRQRRAMMHDRSIAGFFKSHLHNAKTKLKKIRDSRSLIKSKLIIVKNLDTQKLVTNDLDSYQV